MLKQALILLCLTASTAAMARKDDYNYNYNASDSLFTRDAPDSQFPLMPYPQDDATWIDVYVNNTYPNTVKMQNPGIYWDLNNRSIQYTLDIISPKGFHNVSQEVLHCGSQQNKTLAFADTVTQRWIPIQNPQWKQVASAISSHDTVRYQIYRTLCDNGYPLQESELQKKINNLGR